MGLTDEQVYRLSQALENVFVSPNVSDSNGEPANLVDVMAMIARELSGMEGGLYEIAKAIREREDNQGRRRSV